MSSQVKSFTNRRSHVADWERTQKPRVWRGQGRLLLIAFLALTSYVALPATLYGTVRLVLEPEGGWEKVALGSLIALVGSLVLGTVLSAVTKCGLCHGTPMLGKNCRKHVLANKLPCLTYRASAILHLIFTGKFRCMYCSTPFRLGGKEENGGSRRGR
jgi:hypothetical protein